MDGEAVIALVSVVLIFGPIMLAVWSHHKRKMVELEIQKQQAVGGNVAGQIEALWQEIAELRRTSTEFDMSIDANLQGLQQRIAFLEGRVQELEAQASSQVR